jgi:hypothetical protein
MELAYKLFLTFLDVRSAAIVNTGQHDLSRENVCADFCPPNNFDFTQIFLVKISTRVIARCKASERQTSMKIPRKNPTSSIILLY